MAMLKWLAQRLPLFFFCFYFEIYFAQAQVNLVAFAEKPEKCVEYETFPCAVSSGNNPYFFYWKKSRWDLAKNTVVSGKTGNRWQIALGHFVIKSEGEQVIDTPFGEIQLAKSSVFVELEDSKVTVSVLSGDMVKFIPRGGEGEQLLSPGFSNWYGGIGPNGQDMGVPMVISLNEFAKKRAYFFTDHKLGFTNELKQLATTIKEATEIAAQMHKDLVAGKMALLQAQYDAEVERGRQRQEFNRYLRLLFRKKVNFDY